MDTIITAGLAYDIETSMLKAVHLESFSSRLIKAKIFILQVNNKITDAAEASKKRKIRYEMSLLRGPTAEWAANYVINTEEDIFQTYANFKAQFLRRFMNSNSSETAVERLMSIKQGKQSIQEYCTKILNLVRQANLRDQTVKALIFKDFYFKNQKKVIMTNSLKSKKELILKMLKKYLVRVERLLYHEKVQQKA